MLFLDLGSGGNTPIIFKIPFMSWTRDWPSAIYATINKGQAFTAPEIKDKSIVIDDDIVAVPDELVDIFVLKSVHTSSKLHITAAQYV